MLFGAPYIPFSIAQLPISIFIPAFYAEERGVPLALVGLIIALTRLSDVVTDPLIGVLSDRTRSRLGRRKPWIAAGVPVLALAAWMLYAPPADAGAWHLALWIFAIYLAFTLIDLPFKSWGAEVSKDYSERSLVTGWREALGQVGTLFALGLTAAITLNGGTVGEAMRLMAIGVAIGAPILFGLVLWRIKEPPPDGFVRKTPLDWKTGLKIVVKNGAFLRLAFCAIALVMATFIGATLNQLYVTHILGQPDIFAPVLFVSLLVSVICAPFWVWVSNRIGKHRAIAIAAGIGSLFQIPTAFLGEGQGGVFAALIIGGGTASAAITILSNSMAADVVDLDVARTGKSRSGLYFAVWGMAIKASVALAVLIATAIPSFLGFDAQAEVQTEAARTGLAWTFALLPASLVALAVPALWTYPITANRQRRLRAAIDRRRAAQAGSDAQK